MAGNLKARSPGLERPDSIIRKTIHHMGSNYEKKYAIRHSIFTVIILLCAMSCK